MSLKWLHISDLHYNPPDVNYDTHSLREKLLECIKTEKILVEAVFFTGDFRFAKNSAVTAKQAADDMLSIAHAAGVSEPKNIHIVPGNHDLERLETAKGNTPLLDSAKAQYENGEFKGTLGEAGNIACRQYLLGRFGFFYEVACEMQNTVWTDRTILHHCIEHEKYKSFI